MRTWTASILIALACVVAIPGVALAQASITGTARDASGAVLPGVTVEVSSPVLIEKVRTVMTDGSGQFRLIDLRPGRYGVTFSLSGFSTVRREGIELTGTFTATVNVELRVGGLEETVTVTGESPIVDVQSVTQQRVIDADAIAALPSGRAASSLAALIPAIIPKMLRFQLQVWSTEHLKTAGRLRSDLNFEVWRQLAAAGVAIPPMQGAVVLGLQLVPSSKQ